MEELLLTSSERSVINIVMGRLHTLGYNYLYFAHYGAQKCHVTF